MEKGPMLQNINTTGLLSPDKHEKKQRGKGADEKAGGERNLPSSTVADLDVETLAGHIAQGSRESAYIKQILTSITDDPDIITYRQEVFEDIYSHPDLENELTELLPLIRNLHQFTPLHPEEHLVYEVTRRLGELEMFLECIDKLDTIFKRYDELITSEGFRRLRETVDAILGERVVQKLREELPDLMAEVRNIKSVSIGINLDHRLRPVQATLLSIDSKTYDGCSASLLNRLFEIKSPKNEWRGIAQLHSVPSSATTGTGVSTDNSSGRTHPMMVPLFRDLAEVLNKTCRPIAQALRQYININTSFLTTLEQELTFFIGAADMCTKIVESGLPMCRPRIVPKRERRFSVQGIYNPNLVFHCMREGPSTTGARKVKERIVTNDVEFNAEKRVFILTGPNRGGKTTYIQSIGLTQIMAQAGLYVPGERGEMSPVDAIYTHFPVKEQPDMQSGRFGEEAKRLNTILEHASPYSLILLNESLSNTSHSESLYLSRDVVKIILLLGARTVFATHLHELAQEIDGLNSESGEDSKAISMVSQIMKDEQTGTHFESEAGQTGTHSESEAGQVGTRDSTFRRTFKIVPGPPAGRSYAREIASHYGITYDRLKKIVEEKKE